MYRSELYEIRIKERLEPYWAEQVTGMSILYDDAGGTLLTGFLPDQSALYGVLNKLHDRQLFLSSVKHIDT